LGVRIDGYPKTKALPASPSSGFITPKNGYAVLMRYHGQKCSGRNAGLDKQPGFG
jgi:hypothetical protein